MSYFKIICLNVRDKKFYKESLYEVYFMKNIAKIGKYAFGNNNLNKVILPSSVTEIGEGAFYRNNIKKLVLSNKLKCIPEYAFEYNKIKNFDLPKDIEKIKAGAFRYNSLEKIILNENLKEISEYAFADNTIKELVINENLEKIGQYAFNHNHIKYITLNNKIKEIEENAFASNHLKSLIIPDNIVSIGNSAFRINQITELKLGANINHIGEHAFASNKLKQVEIPLSLSYISESCFRYNEINHVFIPNNIKKIEESAFNNNPIFSVVLSEGLEEIGDFAFADSNLTVLKIPDSVEKIGEDIVTRCTIIYRGQTFDEHQIRKFGTHHLPLLVKIKKLCPSFDINKLSREELDLLPDKPEIIKGFVNNFKKYHQTITDLKVNQPTKYQTYTGHFYNINIACFMKLNLIMGTFNKNGKVLDELFNDIKKMYQTVGMSGIEEMVLDLRNVESNPKLTEVIRASIDNDFVKMHYLFNPVYKDFKNIQKGILTKKENEIRIINTEYKRTNDPNLLSKMSELKKCRKQITLADLEQFIINHKFDVKNEEMNKIIPILAGEVSSYEYRKLEEIYQKALELKEHQLKSFKGDGDKYSYEWLENTDSFNLVLGYLVNCCAKIGSAGEDIMTQSMINPNIKNLVIYNKAKRIVAKTTAFYNNDYIICNNIEVADFFMNNPQTTEIDRVELLNAVLSGILAQVNMLPDNLQKVVIGMDRNDLVKELEKYALQIIRDNLILNYKYHNYQGDANNRAKGQAIVYIR